MTSTLAEKLGVTTPGSTEWINVLIFGDPKVGKTRLVSTAQDHPDTSPLLLLDIEGGTITIRHRKDIEVVTVRTIAEFQAKLNLLQQAAMGIEEFPYRTVAIDNMSELQALDLIPIMEAAYKKNPDKVDKDVPGQREWGKTREHMRAITRAVKALPCHTIMTAHIFTKELEGQPARHYPGFGGKAKSDVPGFMDIVGYMTMVSERGKPSKTQIQFKGTRGVLAGDRFDMLGDIMDNPTFPEIWEKIKGSGE